MEISNLKVYFADASAGPRPPWKPLPSPNLIAGAHFWLTPSPGGHPLWKPPFTITYIFLEIEHRPIPKTAVGFLVLVGLDSGIPLNPATYFVHLTITIA